jgi:transposase
MGDKKVYSAEFKVQVASMVLDKGLSVAQVSKDMSIGLTAVRRWVKQLESERVGKAPIGKPITAEQIRIRELEAQVKQLKQDNDILKKASAFFARELT